MTEYIRWYDKDKYLSAFMTLLQTLSPEVQVEVANDMLLNIPKIIETDFDNYINIMSEHNPHSYKRWYDFSPVLHSAIETMQNLTFEQREELIRSISDIIIQHMNIDFDESMEKFGAITTKKEEDDE